ncbi:ATP-binding protein [Parvularcula oceani]|uniref:ATP-binding protein n=1 Tax=Parvularcula oceani TaxID=1247963 RepID=UPI00068B759C|nr:ATP-binding protein [Parvularcula oceani]
MPEAFVRGIRDIGYRSSADAIAEFLDNSIQAYAERVEVVLGPPGNRGRPDSMAVIDDGHGMLPEMIRLAVTWGGTHREGDRVGLGRYGYGLPSSAVSLGRRFTVYSKPPHGDLYAVTLDLDDLAEGAYHDKEGDIVVPIAERARLPCHLQEIIRTAWSDGWHAGTVVLIEKLDRLPWPGRTRFVERLTQRVGVTYHKLRDRTDLYVDGTYVEPIDPLFLTGGQALFELDDDRATAFDSIRLELSAPDTGEYLGAITVRYAWLPPSFGSKEKTRDAVGLNANERFDVMKTYHGVLFSRNGRLVDVQARTPWTSFINNDRYVRAEVEFSATLDEQFGVTTSKQQVTVSDFVWDALQAAGMPKAIEQLRARVRQAKAARYAAGLRESGRTGQVASEVVLLADREATSSASVSRWDRSVSIEHDPAAPFFWMSRSEGRADQRVLLLHLNAAHRFYEVLYDGPQTTAASRSALEVLLFTMADTFLDPKGEVSGYSDEIAARDAVKEWSGRLDYALALMARHFVREPAEENEEFGLLAWAEESA